MQRFHYNSIDLKVLQKINQIRFYGINFRAEILLAVAFFRPLKSTMRIILESTDACSSIVLKFFVFSFFGQVRIGDTFYSIFVTNLWQILVHLLTKYGTYAFFSFSKDHDRQVFCVLWRFRASFTQTVTCGWCCVVVVFFCSIFFFRPQ